MISSGSESHTFSHFSLPSHTEFEKCVCRVYVFQLGVIFDANCGNLALRVFRYQSGTTAVQAILIGQTSISYLAPP